MPLYRLTDLSVHGIQLHGSNNAVLLSTEKFKIKILMLDSVPLDGVGLLAVKWSSSSGEWTMIYFCGEIEGLDQVAILTESALI